MALEMHVLIVMILGFLRPGIAENTVANFGLLDQIAALQWIQDNIEEFGGNKSDVTLFGHGTGAACAHLLMLSPVAQGKNGAGNFRCSAYAIHYTLQTNISK